MIKRGRQVIRLDKSTGEELGRYVSISNAAVWLSENGYKTNKGTIESIRRTCIGEYNSSMGFAWKYVDIDEIEGEEWRDIDSKNIGGRTGFRVSSEGRIARHSHLVNQHMSVVGYMRITIWHLGKATKNISVHRLVALTFIPNPDNKLEINHKDRDKTNNRVSNLEWMTNQENVEYSKAKYVMQYDLKGNYITTHRSVTKAAQSVNGDTANISTVCLGKGHKTHRGFIWRYPDNDFSKDITHKPKKTKAVNQYDLNMNFIKTFISRDEAAEEVGGHKGCIGAVCRGERKSASGFIWKYE